MRLDVFRAVARKFQDPRQTPLAAAATARAAAYGVGVDPDDYDPLNRFYTRIGGAATNRDQPDALRRAALERAVENGDINPLVARYHSFVKDWTRPGQFKPRARDPKVDAVVQRFWADPRNDWQAFLPPLMQSKMASGVVALPCVVDRATADVLVDFWDPVDIGKVEFAPGSRRRRETIEYKPSRSLTSTPVEYQIIRPWYPSDGGRGVAGKLRGADPTSVSGITGVLYFAFNCWPNAAYGRGDYFASLDYLTLLDDLHHAYADRAQMLARIPGSIGVANAGDVDAVKAEAQKLQGYASVLVHTLESVVPNLGAPSSGAADAKEQERMLRVYGASPMGVPPHLLSGDFTEGNRAIAQGTEDPSYMRGLTQQDELAQVIETACRYAVDTVALLQPQRLEGVTDWSIDVERPRLVTDPEQAARTLQTLGAALDSAVAARRLDERTARDMYIRAVNDLGVAIVRADEVEARLDAAPKVAAVTVPPTVNEMTLGIQRLAAVADVDMINTLRDHLATLLDQPAPQPLDEISVPVSMPVSAEGES